MRAGGAGRGRGIVVSMTTPDDARGPIATQPVPDRSSREEDGAAVAAPDRPSRARRAAGWMRRHLLLIGVLAAALVVRVWDLAAQLPVMHHPDEPGNTGLIESIVATGDLNPHFFNYPSLFIYLQAAVSPDGPLLGWLIPGDVAEAPGRIAMGVGYAPSVPTVLLHRGLSVAFGVAVVAVVWTIARRAFGGTLGPAVAAALVAFSPNLIEHSQYVTPDMLGVLMSALAVLAALHVLDSGSTRAYLVAGALVGLSVSAKYNAALVALAVVAAFAAGIGRPGRPLLPAVGRLALSGLAAGAAFLATTPYALLDRTTFLDDLAYERSHYAEGHIGMQGDTPRFYAGLLLGEETVLVLLAVVGIVAALVAGHRRVTAVLLAFPVGYAAFVSTMVVRNDRTIMIVLPVLAVFAGYAVQWLRDQGRARLGRPVRRAAGVVLGAAIALPVAVGLPAAMTQSSVHDARVEAARWVADNLTPGSTVVLESYGPWIDPTTYVVADVKELVGRELPPEADYVIASEAIYARFTEHPDQYPGAAAAYAELFASWDLVREFRQEGNSIRVYRVPPA
jgi:4-amino-4-deoxy-L-arabinose transferase-like glycosyltransferase